MALSRRERLIRELRERLAKLGVEAGGLGTRAKPRVRAAGGPGRSRRRGKPVSAARRAAMRAQGRDMAAGARLAKAGRAKVKAIREKSAVSAAIAAAKRMAR